MSATGSRSSGLNGRAAYAPRMLLAVLLYGYYTGTRFSRQIERRCQEDSGGNPRQPTSEAPALHHKV